VIGGTSTICLALPSRGWRSPAALRQRSRSTPGYRWMTCVRSWPSTTSIATLRLLRTLPPSWQSWPKQERNLQTDRARRPIVPEEDQQFQLAGGRGFEPRL